MLREDIGHRKDGNCFTHITAYEKAAKRVEEQHCTEWPQRLEGLLARNCPGVNTVLATIRWRTTGPPMNPNGRPISCFDPQPNWIDVFQSWPVNRRSKFLSPPLTPLGSIIFSIGYALQDLFIHLFQSLFTLVS